MSQLLECEGVVFVAEDRQGGLIGFAECSVRHDHVEGATISPVPYLEGWFVAAAFRKQGIGRALMDAVESWAVSRSFTELASDAEVDNLSSIQFHQRLGFAEVGRNVAFLKALASGACGK